MEEMIGVIKMFAGNFAPRGWALCDGQLLSISQNTALFSILGTTYGGDGRTTFALPDLRGRVSMHPGNGPGLSQRRLGEKGGSETNTLNVNQMPSHGHSVPLNAPVASGSTSRDKDSSASDAGFVKASLPKTQKQTFTLDADHAGGSQPVNNLQPYQCVNFIICLVGIFPSRS
ncbi:MAG: tail fiber protein [bacterium]|jgi:microcystin-dependent protein